MKAYEAGSAPHREIISQVNLAEDGALGRNPRQRRGSAKRALIFIALYFVFQACFVSLISHGAGLDDAELISNLSFWNWGYGGSQPPLYTWLAYGLTAIFGLNFAVLQFLRFGILASGFFAVYLGLRGLNIAPKLAAFSCLALFLLPQIGWESQRALIHSVLGTAGSAWSFAAFVWFIRSPSYGRALALGAAFTAAILGKYNGLIFIAALLISGAFAREARSALISRYFAAAIAAAVLLMMPALVFMAQHPKGVLERSVKFQTIAGAPIMDRIFGLWSLAQAGLNFLALLLALSLILALIVRLRQKRARCEVKPVNAVPLNTVPVNAVQQAAALRCNAAHKRAMHFLGMILLGGLAFCAVMVLVSGAAHIKDRWLQPVLFLAPGFAVLWLAQLDKTARAARALGILGIIAACAVPPALYANLYQRAGRVRPPVQNLDYQALYARLSAAGKITTILAPDPFYAGNLRLLNPQIKTLFAETPYAAERLQRPLVLLWKSAPQLPAKLAVIIRKAGIEPQNLPPVREADIAYRFGQVKQGAARPTERIYYIYLP